MSVSLKAIMDSKGPAARDKAIARRLSEGVDGNGTVIGGLGYWAAMDSPRKIAAPAAPHSIG